MFFKFYFNDNSFLTIEKAEHFDFNAANGVVEAGVENITVSIVNHLGDNGYSLLEDFNKMKSKKVVKIEWYQEDVVIYSTENDEIKINYSINANPSVQEYLNFNFNKAI